MYVQRRKEIIFSVKAPSVIMILQERQENNIYVRTPVFSENIIIWHLYVRSTSFKISCSYQLDFQSMEKRLSIQQCKFIKKSVFFDNVVLIFCDYFSQLFFLSMIFVTFVLLRIVLWTRYDYEFLAVALTFLGNDGKLRIIDWKGQCCRFDST